MDSWTHCRGAIHIEAALATCPSHNGCNVAVNCWGRAWSTCIKHDVCALEAQASQQPLNVYTHRVQVDGAYMSVATLTDEPLDKMDCIENAPSIRAIVIGKGEDFGNVDGMVDGSPVMPQVRLRTGMTG